METKAKQIVTAPMGAVSNGRGEVAYHTHLVELTLDADEAGGYSITKVLCRRAKPEHILDDSCMFTAEAPTCPVCAGKARKLFPAK